MIIVGDCFEVLATIDKKSVDLILVDPPYGISRHSQFAQTNASTPEEMSVKYGKVTNDFGDWDKVHIDLDNLFYEYYRVLRPGGTLVFFYDVWKSGDVKIAAETAGFKQPRICQWQKSNPVPINSGRNYLSNAVEFFFTFVRGGKPTFNSQYDNGVYKFPTVTPWESLGHPTQKPLSLIRAIVEKHSNQDDLVLDTFAGSGTTAEACMITGRRYIVSEKSAEYVDMIHKRLIDSKQKNDNLI